jgi:hypothetical protein
VIHALTGVIFRTIGIVKSANLSSLRVMATICERQVDMDEAQRLYERRVVVARERYE